MRWKNLAGVVLAVVAIICVIGCCENKIDRIAPGMPESKVVEILGQASSREERSGVVWLHYQECRADYVILVDSHSHTVTKVLRAHV